MSELLLSHLHLNGREVDMLIRGGRIAAVAMCNSLGDGNVERVDCTGLEAFPGLCNMHCHMPMVFLRGLGDDTPLSSWLNEYIWPAEQQWGDELMYQATLQACHELLASGVTFVNDMYFRLPAMARAVRESGIRARLGYNLFGNATELDDADVQQLLCSGDKMVDFSIAPHSIYTVSTEGLSHAASRCAQWGLKMHIHMSETQREVDDCMMQHGMRPWQLLKELKVLELIGTDIIAAHCLYLSDEEMALMGEYGVTAVHCPHSNLKLGSGFRFPMQELVQRGVEVALGTDGAASSNNLDMIEAMRTAALLQKGWRADPTACSAQQILDMATCGHKLEVGEVADLFLVPYTPVSPLTLVRGSSVSNLVYTLSAGHVRMTIVDGKIVYHA